MAGREEPLGSGEADLSADPGLRLPEGLLLALGGLLPPVLLTSCIRSARDLSEEVVVADIGLWTLAPPVLTSCLWAGCLISGATLQTSLTGVLTSKSLLWPTACLFSDLAFSSAFATQVSRSLFQSTPIFLVAGLYRMWAKPKSRSTTSWLTHSSVTALKKSVSPASANSRVTPSPAFRAMTTGFRNIGLAGLAQMLPRHLGIFVAGSLSLIPVVSTHFSSSLKTGRKW
jgi:hypothetical protein